MELLAVARRLLIERVYSIVPTYDGADREEHRNTLRQGQRDGRNESKDELLIHAPQAAGHSFDDDTGRLSA